MKREQMPESEVTRCRTCNEWIVWTTTERNKDMPVDVNEGGTGKTAANIRLTVLNGQVKSQVVPPHLAYGNPSLHLSHFARCPHAAKWRNRPSASNTRTTQRRRTTP